MVSIPRCGALILISAITGCAQSTPGSPASPATEPTTDSVMTNATANLTRTESYGAIQHLPVWEAVSAADVVPGVEALLQHVETRFSTLETELTPTWGGLMAPLEAINHDLGEAVGRISHLLSVTYSDELQEAYDEVRPKVISMSSKMGQSRAIYDGMQALKDSAEWQSLNDAQRRIVTESLAAMERNGVHLDGEDKARFQAIQNRLGELSNKFRTNLVKEEAERRVIATTLDEIAGVPAAIVEMAAKQAREDGEANASADTGPWHFVINGVNFAVVTHGEHRDLRERFYRAYRSRGLSDAYDNRPVLEEILQLRQELAQLVGFNNYAELSVDAKMAGAPSAVWQLLNQLQTAAQPVAKKELAELERFAKNGGFEHALAPWDVSFWSERLQEDRYSYDSEKLREYFQLPVVLEGLFALTKKLYNADITPVRPGTVPVWHEDVQFFEVRQDGEVIAGFFLDPYARPGEKRGGAWMNTVVDRTRLLAANDRESSIPVALLVMNARPPADGDVALLSLDEVRTLFHEFGHGTQLLFTEIEEGGASGLDLVEWDAVELASQFNEYWMDHPPFLKNLTQHVQSSNKLDDATIARVIDSANFMAGNATLRQLLFGRTDMMIHEQYGVAEGDNRSPFEMEREVARDTIVLPMLDDETQLPAFGHLFAGGYAAGYYSYKWAEVLAADAFSAFEEVGLENDAQVATVAQAFKDTVLALGGSKPAAEVYRLFRGRDASPDALLEKQGLAVQ